MERSATMLIEDLFREISRKEVSGRFARAYLADLEIVDRSNNEILVNYRGRTIVLTVDEVSDD